MGHHGNSFLSFPAVVGEVGGWVELGRTTLGSAGDTIDVTSLADKRYYMVLGDFQNSGAIRPTWRLNSVSTGTPYAARRSVNGAADATNVSTNQMFLSDNNSNYSAPDFSVAYFANLSAKEKLCIYLEASRNTAGAANAPNRGESVGKHAQTSNPINAVNVFNDQGGSFNTNSQVVVLGWDPADTHTTNFWEEIFSEQLTSDNGSFSTGTIPAKKYLWLQFYQVGMTGNAAWRFNGDSTTSYARRHEINGAADATVVSQTSLLNVLTGGTGDLSTFTNAFIVNNSANEKLIIFSTVFVVVDGSGTAPQRIQGVCKWDDVAAQITSMTVDDSGAGFDTGSFLKIWGSD